MPDFTLFIPSEIISDILSHVNQLDCTEGMIVCRRWYKLVPQYGMHVWKELEISEESSWRRFNNAMLECLGSHVKKISVTSYHNSSYILRRLENQGCHIQSLGNLIFAYNTIFFCKKKTIHLKMSILLLLRK